MMKMRWEAPQKWESCGIKEEVKKVSWSVLQPFEACTAVGDAEMGSLCDKTLDASDGQDAKI